MRMTEDLLTTFNISLVVRGSVSETGPQDEEEQRRRYSVPQQQGVMRCVLPGDISLTPPLLMISPRNRRAVIRSTQI